MTDENYHETTWTREQDRGDVTTQIEINTNSGFARLTQVGPFETQKDELIVEIETLQEKLDDLLNS